MLLLLFLLSINAYDKCGNGMFGPSSRNDPDYIIVGGGAGGSVAINKCITKGYRCTLIERGTDYVDPFAEIPSQNIVSNFVGSVKFTASAPLRNLYNKVIVFNEPNIIGGSTSINGMISVFTDINKFYAELNITGWSYEEMLPYYLSVTKSSNRPSYNGLVDVTNANINNSQYLAFKAAITQVFPNIPERIPDMNTALIISNFSGYGPPETTVKTFQTGIGTVGTRSTGYTSYIQPIRNNPNLRIMTGSTVEKITFRGNTNKIRDVIVKYIDYLGVEQTCEISAKDGVILSAGALRTPQILLQSGIGPANELRNINISVVRNISNVGKNLDDHPTLNNQYIGFSPDSLYSANINGHAYWNYQDNPALVDDWSLQLIGILGTDVIPPGLKIAINVLMNQKSKGSVVLQSFGNPIFDLGYFNDPQDLFPAAMGYNKTTQIMTNLGFIPITPVVCPPFLPNCLTNVTEYYIAAYLAYAGSGYHYTGTCALNKVVDPQTGKIYGFDDLYVIDASVLPKSPRGNTQISVYAVALKLASLIF
jgi:choline dehydrogenase